MLKARKFVVDPAVCNSQEVCGGLSNMHYQLHAHKSWEIVAMPWSFLLICKGSHEPSLVLQALTSYQITWHQMSVNKCIASMKLWKETSLWHWLLPLNPQQTLIGTLGTKVTTNYQIVWHLNKCSFHMQLWKETSAADLKLPWPGHKPSLHGNNNHIIMLARNYYWHKSWDCCRHGWVELHWCLYNAGP